MPRTYGPRQIVLVTCREELDFMGKTKEIHNIITVDWHMPCSFEPFLYAISIGKSRASYDLIKKSGVFVVNFIPFTLKDAAIFCGRHSGRHHDKFKETGLTMIESNHVDCPKIKEAIGYIECNVIEEIEAGDHVIFVGEVTHQELKREEKRLFHFGGSEFLAVD
ncbi:MAG: flavin reductase family protein [Candidatus Woesearchaeota archaeon]